MSINKKTALDYDIKVALVKKYFMENKDRKIKVSDIELAAKTTYFSARGIIMALVRDCFLYCSDPGHVNKYRYRDAGDDLLTQFMRSGKNRAPLREFAVYKKQGGGIASEKICSKN